MINIFKACEYGTVADLHYFIQEGLTSGKCLNDIVNTIDSEGHSPLHYASMNSLELVRILLDHGADINIRDIYGSTALYCAIEYDKSDIVEFLLAQKDIEINIQDNDGDTPLHMAVLHCPLNIVKLLLDYNCNYYLCNKKNRTPKDLAIKCLDDIACLYRFCSDHITELKAIIELLQSYEEILEVKEPAQ